MDDLATLDGRENGIGLHDGKHSGGGFGRARSAITANVQHKEKQGEERERV